MGSVDQSKHAQGPIYIINEYKLTINSHNNEHQQ